MDKVSEMLFNWRAKAGYTAIPQSEAEAAADPEVPLELVPAPSKTRIWVLIGSLGVVLLLGLLATTAGPSNQLSQSMTTCHSNCDDACSGFVVSLPSCSVCLF